MQLAVLDFETDRWDADRGDLAELKARFAVLLFFEVTLTPTVTCKERYWELCRSADDVAEILLSKEDFIVCFIHNLNFDLTFVFEAFLQRRCRVSPTAVGSRFIRAEIAAYDSNKGRWRPAVEFRNSYCLVSSSLAKIGEEIGFSKGIMPDSLTGDNGEAIAYCLNDCRVVMHLLEAWWRGFDCRTDRDLLTYSLTAASASFKEFRKRVPTTTANPRLHHLCLYDPQWQAFWRRFYYGGRVDVWRGGIARGVKYFDVNNLYAFTMSRAAFQIPPYFHARTEDDAEVLSDPSLAAILCEVDESDAVYPLIPERVGNSTFYLAKRKEALLFPEEFQYLRERGRIRRILEFVLGSGQESPFGYLAEMYDERKRLREAGQGAMAIAKKIVILSTYGRFGMRTERERAEYRPIELLEETVKEGVVPTEVFESFFEIREKFRLENAAINPYIAARVTALSRLYLLEGLEKSEGWYSDTDSIVAREFPADFIGGALGQFKVEKEFNWFLALGPKDYLSSVPSYTKVKGASLGAGDRYERFFNYHSDTGVVQCRPAGIREILRLLREGRLADFSPVQRVLLKKASTIYGRRILLRGHSLPLTDASQEADTMARNRDFLSDALEEARTLL